MTLLHPLLVMRDRKEADRLAAQLDGVLYAAHAYTDTEQGALDLLAGRPFGVVILDDQLRQGSGLQALARLRERYPALPVIMVSGARSEGTAIDAFHLGVTDYIPKKRGYGDLVAALVAQLAAQEPLTPQTRLLDIPENVPAALLRPTSENRLRLIGDECDAAGLRELAVLETTGGFVVRARCPHEQSTDVLEFADAHFAQLVSDAIAKRGARSLVVHPLLPTGYEDALRAIGHELDQHRTRDVTILELEQRLVVSGRLRTGTTTVHRTASNGYWGRRTCGPGSTRATIGATAADQPGRATGRREGDVDLHDVGNPLILYRGRGPCLLTQPMRRRSRCGGLHPFPSPRWLR